MISSIACVTPNFRLHWSGLPPAFSGVQVGDPRQNRQIVAVVTVVMRDSVWSSEKSNKAGYRESKFYIKYCFIVRIQCLCLFSGLQNILSNLWTEGKALHFTNWLSATSISAVCSSVSTVQYIYIFDQKSIWHHLWWHAFRVSGGSTLTLLNPSSLAKQKPSLPLLWTPSSENIEKLRGGTLEGKPQQFE